MVSEFKVKKPFFEIGPKVYLYGQAVIDLALAADRFSAEYGVDVIFSAQYVDIPVIAKLVKNIHVFAQHIDAVRPGRGIGAVLPEAVKCAGAEGTLLNHAEKPLSLAEIKCAVERADEVGLASFVCCPDMETCEAAAKLSPDLILAESPKLIGTGTRSKEEIAEIRKINETVRAIDPRICVLHAAGIHDENDVYQLILAGADGTGSTSAIMTAPDPAEMTRKMLQAVRRAWNEREAEK